MAEIEILRQIIFRNDDQCGSLLRIIDWPHFLKNRFLLCDMELPSVHSRTGTGVTTEYHTQTGKVGKSALGGDGAERHVGFPQQHLGLLHAGAAYLILNSGR